MRRRFLQVLATFALPGTVLSTLAQTPSFPTRPIRLIVPYPAGGTADLMGRILAEGLSKRYAHPVVVDNRPGAGGHVGAESALQLPADGHTLVFATIAHNGAYKMYKSLRYSPATDLVHVGLVAESPIVLMVRDDLPVRSVAELLALARSRARQAELRLRRGRLGDAHGSGTFQASCQGRYRAGAVPGGCPRCRRCLPARWISRSRSAARPNRR